MTTLNELNKTIFGVFEKNFKACLLFERISRCS